MLLCDIGNTSYHFYDGKNDEKKLVKEFDPSSMSEDVYYICVEPQVRQTLQNLSNWHDLSCYIDYEKYYETMGVDRILACEALENGVIIDAGSAITLDVVRSGKHEGGFIYPGIKAMQECFSSISSALDYPFNLSLDLDKLPKNSQDAISYGFVKTLVDAAMKPQLDIILTGGDATTLAPLFPHAKIKEFLLFDGMQKLALKNGVQLH